MVVNCVISFDNNPQSVFFAGQTLFGTITLQCDKPKKVREILLIIKGYAHVHWSKRPKDANGKYTRGYKIAFDGHLDYIDSKKDVFQCNGNRTQTEIGPILLENSKTIAPGTHVYNFNHRIPPYCPTSFEGQHGHIRYFVKVVLVRPWKFNQSFTKSFNVLKLLDLNYLGAPVRTPVCQSLERTLGIWPLKNGVFQMQIRMPQMGYVAGQSIPVTLVAANRSSVSIYEIKLRLVMKATFISTSPVSEVESRVVIQRLKGRGIPKKTNQTMNLNLFVPPTPPTCIDLNSIIHIIYELEVQLKPAGLLHRKQMCRTEIVIGTIPIIHLGSTMNIPSVANNMPRYSQTLPSSTSGSRRYSDPMALGPIQPPTMREPPRIYRYSAAITSWPALRPPASSIRGFTMALPDDNCPPPLPPRPANILPIRRVHFNNEMPSYIGSLERYQSSANLPNGPPPLYEEVVPEPRQNPHQTNNDYETNYRDPGPRVFKPFYPRFTITTPAIEATPEENEDPDSSSESASDNLPTVSVSHVNNSNT